MLWFTQKVLRRMPGSVDVRDGHRPHRARRPAPREFADAGAVSREADVHAETAAHLRELLGADHRYVFTLIHKFRLARGRGGDAGALGPRRRDRHHRRGAPQPVRHARAEHAHGAARTPRSWASPARRSSSGEELTRQEFGDYVAIYNFRDAIEDGATVPLYYENRIPELQLVNEDFDDELNELLEEAELDDEAEGLLVAALRAASTR